MKRVYAKGEFPKGVLINSDVRPVELRDGRTVLLTGTQWFQAADDKTRYAMAQVIAYDEERPR